ncbi:MAG: MmgE/PrpD family protein, partial [Pseudomonadota bacterium]
GTREDPQVLALADRVQYETDPQSAYPASYSGEVELTLASGERLTQRQEVNRGARDNPLSDAQIDAKFYANAERCFDRPRAERVRDLILTLERQPDLNALALALMARS